MFRRDTSEPDTEPTPPPTTNKAQATSTPATPTTPAVRTTASPTATARLGPSLRFKGEVHGDEDLLIEGKLEGEVRLSGQRVTIAPQARIEGDVHAETIDVRGEVKGNLFGKSEVIVEPEAKVDGNLTSPRVNLQEGCRFQGSIDMSGTKP